jgi:multicomponent Na+:H+ antiporter subunit D
VFALLILVPLAGLILMNLPIGAALKRLAFPLALALTVAQSLLIACPAGVAWLGGGTLDHYFNFSLGIDGLSRVLLLSVGIVVFTTLLVGRAMLVGPRRQFNFVSLMLLAMIGMNGTVMLSDLFSLYVFIEITSVSSFILIALTRGRDSLEGAFKYIILSAVATIMMLASVAVLLMVAGGTSFEVIAAALKNSPHSLIARIGMGAFVCALFIKGGLVPFHGWLPAAYSAAPAPVSIFLAGIATKASGIYALVRLATYVFPQSPAVNNVLMLVGAASIIIGAVAAVSQSDIKRLLAYSSISQVGYIILALGCGSPLAVAGAIFHLFNHAIFKSLLFVSSAAVEQRTGTTDMAQLGGLGSRMPVTSATSAIAALSTAGIPPLAGFWSKLIIIVALWQAGFHAYAVIAIGMSVLTLAYLLVMHRKVFFGNVGEALAQTREASWGLLVPAVVLAAITIGLGVAMPYVVNTFILPISRIL